MSVICDQLSTNVLQLYNLTIHIGSSLESMHGENDVVAQSIS